jgi:hypothetical protein
MPRTDSAVGVARVRRLSAAMVFVAPAHRRDGLAGRQRSRTPGVSLRGERRRKSITPTVMQRRPSAGSRQVEHVLQISDQPNAPSGATRGCLRTVLADLQPVPKRPVFFVPRPTIRFSTAVGRIALRNSRPENL